MESCMLSLPKSKIILKIRVNINVISGVCIGILAQEARENYVVKMCDMYCLPNIIIMIVIDG
jgi:hypothetical protein